MPSTPKPSKKPSGNVDDVSPAAKKRRLSFTDITSSRLFTIFVGPAKMEHNMHAVLFSAQSSVLEALVNNGMKESNEGAVIWKHVSNYTFSKFCQYAYTGGFLIDRPVDRPVDATKDNVHESFSKWLIQHADLIVFAECYAIDGLLASSASKLQNALVGLPDSPETKGRAVADLFQHAFMKKGTGILHDIIKGYLVEHYGALWKDAYFQGVVKQTEELSHVLLDCMASRKQGVVALCARVKCGHRADVLDALNESGHCGLQYRLVYSESGRVPSCE